MKRLSTLFITTLATLSIFVIAPATASADTSLAIYTPGVNIDVHNINHSYNKRSNKRFNNNRFNNNRFNNNRFNNKGFNNNRFNNNRFNNNRRNNSYYNYNSGRSYDYCPNYRY